MEKTVNFTCNYNNAAGIDPAVIRALNLSVPEVYWNAKSMACLAAAIQEKNNTPFCVLPFCYTTEAENMGGHIICDDENTGPKAREFAYPTVEELARLPDIDFSRGRIHQVLEACKILKAQGKAVALELSGPLTICNNLTDISLVFRAWRKKPDLIEQIFSHLLVQSVAYAREAQKAGVDMLCFADPTASIDIIGPKLAQAHAQLFIIPFAQEILPLLDENTILQLCPKIAHTLINLELADWRQHVLAPGISYPAACLEARGQVKIVGQNCIKNMQHILRNGTIKELCLR